MNILQIQNLSKTIETENKNLEIFDNLNFQIKKGSFTTLIGPSGCGKSTILRILANLLKPTSGQIIWSDPKPKISFVFQNFGIFPFLNVFENIEFGLKMSGVKTLHRHKVVSKLINEIGLNGFEDKHPRDLSGGMKQRVGIARALTMEPDLLLMDEPFSALDEFTADNLRKLILDLWKSRQTTILMVTHLIKEAVELSDQIIVLTPKKEKSQETFECHLKHPRNLRSTEFYKYEDSLKKLLI